MSTKQRWTLSCIIACFIIAPAAHAASGPLDDFHKDQVSKSCPVQEWNTIFNICENPVCGQVAYDHRQGERRTDANGSCPGFWTNAECAPMIGPGEVMGGCSTSCTTKSKLSRPLYWEATHTGTFYKLKPGTCATDACGIKSREPKSYTSCRSVDHDIDNSRTSAGMNTGKDVDRALALLAMALKETTGLPPTSRAYIIQKLQTNGRLDDDAWRVDAVRVALLRRGSAITEAEVDKAWDEPAPLKVESASSDAKVKEDKPLASNEQALSIPKISISTFSIREDRNVELEKLLASGRYVTRQVSALDVPGGAAAGAALAGSPSGGGSGASDSEAIGMGSTASAWDYSGYSLGYGVNSVTGEPRGICLVQKPFTPGKEPPPKKAVQFSMQKIEDYQSLLKSLFASASFAVTAGFGKANSSAQFSQTYQSSEHSIYLLVKVDVTLAERNYEFTGLTEEWKKVQNSGETGRKRFYVGCGDRYVKGMKTGASFVALYQIMARTEDEKQSINASLSGGSVGGAFSGSAAFETALQRLHRFSNIEVVILSLGYPGGAVPDTPSEIMKYAREFPDKITSDNAYNIAATTGNYSEFPSFDTGTPFLDGQQTSYLSQADYDFQWLQSRRSILNLAKSQPELFELNGHGSKDLIASELAIIGASDKLSVSAAECFADRNKCMNYVPVSKDIWIPTMRPNDIVIGGCAADSIRFKNHNGGCLDTATGFTWSAPSRGYWTFAEAKAYCEHLTENRTRGWTLPNMIELSGLQAPGGGVEGFNEGAALMDWYWTHGGETPPKAQRINIENGVRKEESESLKFRVICRQAA